MHPLDGANAILRVPDFHADMQSFEFSSAGIYPRMHTDEHGFLVIKDGRPH